MGLAGTLMTLTTDDSRGHVPVLLQQVLELLSPQTGQIVLDCTVGRGGHAAAIAPLLGPQGLYIGLDLDPDNIAFCRQRLQGVPCRLELIQANFAHAREVLDRLGVDYADLLLADLGVSSSQLADPARGFSFLRDGPLDMRMDPSLPHTAADLVNHLPEPQLAELLWKLGEERKARKIARIIAERRRRSPITSTAELAQLVRQAYGARTWSSRIDPATRTFMALRIAVNGELEALESLLEQLPRLLRPAPSSRAVVISFHSLEDRRVKHAFLQLEKQGLAQRMTKKPITADPGERAANPRSRSAKLRAVMFKSPAQNGIR